jgi:hypothetical protein
MIVMTMRKEVSLESYMQTKETIVVIMATKKQVKETRDWFSWKETSPPKK